MKAPVEPGTVHFLPSSSQQPRHSKLDRRRKLAPNVVEFQPARRSRLEKQAQAAIAPELQIIYDRFADADQDSVSARMRAHAIWVYHWARGLPQPGAGQ